MHLYFPLGPNLILRHVTLALFLILSNLKPGGRPPSSASHVPSPPLRPTPIESALCQHFCMCMFSCKFEIRNKITMHRALHNLKKSITSYVFTADVILIFVTLHRIPFYQLLILFSISLFKSNAMKPKKFKYCPLNDTQ